MEEELQKFKGLTILFAITTVILIIILLIMAFTHERGVLSIDVFEETLNNNLDKIGANMTVHNITNGIDTYIVTLDMGNMITVPFYVTADANIICTQFVDFKDLVYMNNNVTVEVEQNEE